MKTFLKKAVAATALRLAAAGGAPANDSALGNGSASAQTGTLNPPTNVTPTQPAAGVSTVPVSWLAPVSGVTPLSYTVQRIDQSTMALSSACTTAGTITGTSCSDTSVPNGTYRYRVRAIFRTWSAQSAASATQVTVSNDVTPPSMTNLQLVNAPGKTAGKIETLDKVVVTFSEQVRANSICSAWANNLSVQSTSANVRVDSNGPADNGNDILTITSAPGCPTFRFGTLDLGSANYVVNAQGSGTPRDIEFAASTLSYDGVSHQLTLTLGPTLSEPNGGTTQNVVASSTATFTITSGVTDLAANPVTPATKSTAATQQF